VFGLLGNFDLNKHIFVDFKFYLKIHKGPNSSGKTTTINLITNDLRPESGVVKIFDKNLNFKNYELFQQNIGYCSHESTFWPEITFREHLKLYSIIKNVPNEIIQSECNQY
jgi:ABC-2 type transport system ATP-binding protein